tara:strand:- start:20457 stop:20909 length:453 start_codon:yes stop_codon:yes gene_type:complete
MSADCLKMPPDELSRDGVSICLAEYIEAKAPTFVPILRYDIMAAGRIAGELRVRLGDHDDLKFHFGQIGYEVSQAFRGRGYATMACQLGLSVMRSLGYDEIWITCNPENTASRRVCEKAGGVFAGIFEISPDHVMYAHGIRRKCRYRFPP